MGLVLIVSVISLGSVALLVWKGIPILLLTRDPAAITGYPVYTGYLSNLGIVLWSATAAICLFSARLASQPPSQPGRKPFLLASGLFTLLLLFDDLFLFHEEIAPQYLALPESLLIGGYAALGLIYLKCFAHTILQTDYRRLGMAVIFWGLSLLFDLVPLPALGDNALLLEDGAKFVGIVSWLGYLERVAAGAVLSKEMTS